MFFGNVEVYVGEVEVDVEFSIDEVYEAMSDGDKEEMADLLIVDGFTPKPDPLASVSEWSDSECATVFDYFMDNPQRVAPVDLQKLAAMLHDVIVKRGL